MAGSRRQGLLYLSGTCFASSRGMPLLSCTTRLSHTLHLATCVWCMFGARYAVGVPSFHLVVFAIPMFWCVLLFFWWCGALLRACVLDRCLMVYCHAFDSSWGDRCAVRVCLALPGVSVACVGALDEHARRLFFGVMFLCRKHVRTGAKDSVRYIDRPCSTTCHFVT